MTAQETEAPCLATPLRDDRGGAGIETTFAITALLMVLFFVVGAMRITGADGDVASAARAGARAAATARTEAAAKTDADSVVANALASSGVACSGGPTVDVKGAGVAGNTVTVEVTCVVSLSDVALVGFPGTRDVVASAFEYVDQIRGSG